MGPISTKELKLYDEKEDFNGGPPQPLIYHLTELRNKLIFSLVALSFGMLISFAFSKGIIILLTKIAPSGTAFLQIKPGELFFTSIKVSFYFGFILSSPIIIWQFASFIFPGLNEKEKKIAIPVVLASPVLFLSGSLFAYFFVIPSMLNFLFGFGEGIVPGSISVEYFVSFVLMIAAICGFAFLIPIVILVLASMNIITADMLINKWRYAILSALILGAVLTPTPDPFNMILIGSILIVLYLVSFGVLKLIKK